MNFTTGPIKDTATRTLTIWVSNAPDITISNETNSYALRATTVDLHYTWDGWMFELSFASIRGHRVLRNGSAGSRTATMGYRVRVIDLQGDIRWDDDVPPWIRLLGDRYKDPDNPTI